VPKHRPWLIIGIITEGIIGTMRRLHQVKCRPVAVKHRQRPLLAANKNELQFGCTKGARPAI
jgi:hypothetical protein